MLTLPHAEGGGVSKFLSRCRYLLYFVQLSNRSTGRFSILDWRGPSLMLLKCKSPEFVFAKIAS